MIRVVIAGMLLSGCAHVNTCKIVTEYQQCRERVLKDQLADIPFTGEERWVIRAIDVEQQAACR